MSQDDISLLFLLLCVLLLGFNNQLACVSFGCKLPEGTDCVQFIFQYLQFNAKKVINKHLVE